MDSQTHLIDRLLQASKSRYAPDTSSWHPSRQVESHMRIDQHGRWFHQGSEIKRREMVALFSSLLRVEADRHYLVTPVEKAVIEVEDTPFAIVDFEVDGSGEGARLAVNTNTDVWVPVRTSGQLFMRALPDSDIACPCVDIRDGLLGRFSRAAYFRLADVLIECDGWLGVRSYSRFFRLERAARSVRSDVNG